MAVQDVLQSISETLRSSATVQKIYGEPVSVEGKTIIPVAKLRYGFGAGRGGKKKKTGEPEDTQAPQDNSSGGGGVVVVPVGYIEISDKSSEYVPINGSRKIIGFLAGGFLLGMLIPLLLKKKIWQK
ncbi:MAG: spore germination protein GerW family protein [Bacteroidota bacterium]|nr:spore germination protein GerW family protein [Bacteroidota bacterium]